MGKFNLNIIFHKKLPQETENMFEKFREYGKYRIEHDGIIFSYDEEPEENFESKIVKYSAAYKKQLPQIIEFMMSDIKENYGEVSKEEVSKRLGKPIIDYLNGTVIYCEQSFDNEHIFTFEFLDEEFKELQYFSIDG